MKKNIIGLLLLLSVATAFSMDAGFRTPVRQNRNVSPPNLKGARKDIKRDGGQENRALFGFNSPGFRARNTRDYNRSDNMMTQAFYIDTAPSSDPS